MKEKMKENYNKFLKTLKIENIELLKLTAEKDEKFSPEAKIKIEYEAEYSYEKNTLKVYVLMKVVAIKKGQRKQGFKLTAKYLVKYRSEIKIDDEMFEIFKSTYLLLQIYPYFRNLVHETTLKMGLPPLILQAIKIPISV